MKPLNESKGPDLRLGLDVACTGQELLEFLEAASTGHELHYAILALKGLGGGWPFVEFVGKRSDLKAFYLGPYGGSEDDFNEFLKVDNDLKETIKESTDVPLGTITVAINVDEDWLPEYLEQISDQFNLSFEVQALPSEDDDSTLVQFKGLYGDLQSFYDSEIQEEYNDDIQFDALFEKV